MKLNFSFNNSCSFTNNSTGIYFCQLPKLKCFVDTYFGELSDNSQNSRKFIQVQISNNKVHHLKE